MNFFEFEHKLSLRVYEHTMQRDLSEKGYRTVSDDVARENVLNTLRWQRDNIDTFVKNMRNSKVPEDVLSKELRFIEHYVGTKKTQNE